MIRVVVEVEVKIAGLTGIANLIVSVWWVSNMGVK
jgi:hypothetical protein